MVVVVDWLVLLVRQRVERLQLPARQPTAH
jgi:hypothetical protein